jgi:carbamoyl-phosphate synthase small subunit
MKISLRLNTGNIFEGKSFGRDIGNKDESGEIVFQTGMVGYPESLTDPSYLNQILVLTYPLIGNYGIGKPEYDEYGIDKIFESNAIHIKALIVGEYNEKYSHWRGEKSLGDWLKENGIIGISGVDTRELVKIIRENKNVIGNINNSISNRTLNHNMDSINEQINKDRLKLTIDIFGTKTETKKTILNSNSELLNILVIDCGIKNSQIRSLLKFNVQLTIVDINYNFIDEVLNKCYDGIFISNGPGDPTTSSHIVNQLVKLFESNSNIPVFGICYGHQLIGLASG